MRSLGLAAPVSDMAATEKDTASHFESFSDLTLCLLPESTPPSGNHEGLGEKSSTPAPSGGTRGNDSVQHGYRHYRRASYGDMW